jgi:O-antigen ligase
LALLGGCLIRTMYVTGLAVLVVGLLLFGWVHRPSRKILLVGGIFLCVVGVVAQMARGTQWSILVTLRGPDGAATGLQDRLWMWQAAWKMIQAHPWLGVGLNTFMANYRTYWVGGEWMPRYAHNCYLQVAAETGLIGLAAFLWLLWSMVARWYQAIQRSDPQAPTRMRLIGVSVGLIVFLAQSAIDTNFYALRHAALFWTLAGLSTGLAAAMLEPAPRALATEQPLPRQTRASRSPAVARGAG